MTTERARAEIAFCETVLARGGLTVLTETLAGAAEIGAWDHFPPGDVIDPISGGQWYYHCHPAEEGSAEHGHFHCFLRPEGAEGPVHHLIAVGVAADGRLLRLFTVNHWVVGDDWAPAETVIPLVARFDMQMPRPGYLVNRWLTAVLAAHHDTITGLIVERDRVLAGHRPADGGDPLADRGLEVVSEVFLT